MSRRPKHQSSARSRYIGGQAWARPGPLLTNYSKRGLVRSSPAASDVKGDRKSATPAVEHVTRASCEVLELLTATSLTRASIAGGNEHTGRTYHGREPNQGVSTSDLSSPSFVMFCTVTLAHSIGVAPEAPVARASSLLDEHHSWWGQVLSMGHISTVAVRVKSHPGETPCGRCDGSGVGVTILIVNSKLFILSLAQLRTTRWSVDLFLPFCPSNLLPNQLAEDVEDGVMQSALMHAIPTVFSPWEHDARRPIPQLQARSDWSSQPSHHDWPLA